MSTPLDPASIAAQMTEEEFLAQDSEQDPRNENPDAELISECISTIVDHYDTMERSTRNQMLRLWKYLELLWSGSGPYYWDHLEGSWAAVTQDELARISNDVDIDPTLMNKTLNLIRPYGESLAGVLTTGIPRVKYFPEDADKEEDILAAKSHRNVEKKINDDNFMNLKLIEMIVKLWNGGYVAVYNYSHMSEENGIYEEPIYGEVEQLQDNFICQACGYADVGDIYNAEDDESSGTKKTLDELLTQETEEERECPECGQITPQFKTTASLGMEQQQTGVNYIPKSRQIVEVYGPLNIKIPSMATKEEDIIWLIKEEEKDVAWARAHFPDHKDKIEAGSTEDLDVDRINRATYDISADTLAEYVTLRWAWLKPETYEVLEDEKKIEVMKKHYPNGLKAIFATEQFLEAEAEVLDEQWTLSINPLYPRIMADPLGKALIGLNEEASDLFQLEVETARHAVSETFMDPAHVDFEARAQSRVLPGAATPMTRPPGGRLEDNIAQTKTATLPQEITELDNKIERLFQFISGILPPVFGGPAAGSKTLGEYQESKNQALQRISIIWKVISVLFAKLMAKATKAYIRDLKEDERFVEERGSGNYVNVWIRRADLEGKIGRVRPELSEQFPSTWAQISARVMELLGMNNAILSAWLMHPENVELIFKTLGLDDMYVPQQDQRNKQLYEISQLSLSAPIMPDTDPMTGRPIIDQTTDKEMEPQPSVNIEPIDDHQVHMAVIQAYLNSPIGIELKSTNPPGYQNVILHFQYHQAALMEQMDAAAQDPDSEESQVEDEQAQAESEEVQ